MIWTTVVLTAALAAAPEDKLTLSHVRDTHGLMGPARAADKLLPGGELYVCFDIDGVTIGEDGQVHYSIGTAAADPQGKELFRQEPKELSAPAPLGGASVPAYAHLDVGLQSPPGRYTVTVTVTDLPSKRSQELKRTVEVQKPDFGLVRVKTTADPEGQIPVSVPGAGEALYVSCGAVGFARGGEGKRPDLAFELRVLDEAGKPATARPLSVAAGKDAPADAVLVPAQFLLPLNRPGKFTVELTATDRAGGRKAQLTFPLTVAEPQ